MQPYSFPYLAYFNLINSCDEFVFLDDANFINKGWINRNSILLNEKSYRFTIPLIKSSQNSLIRDIRIDTSSNFFNKFKKTLRYSYSKSPNFETTMQIIYSSISEENTFISELAIKSIKSICSYIGITKEFHNSSSLSKQFSHCSGINRLIEITRFLGAKEYINLPGGKEIYSKEVFKNNGIDLKFINPFLPKYKQFNNTGDFISNLSIIDILMNVNHNEIERLIKGYEKV